MNPSTPSDTPIVIARICTCGHWASEHERGLDCAVGWANDDDREPCDCTRFVFDFEEVR